MGKILREEFFIYSTLNLRTCFSARAREHAHLLHTQHTQHYDEYYDVVLARSANDDDVRLSSSKQEHL
jgi:hypothetical protein